MKCLAQVLQWVGVSRGIATFLFFEKSVYNAFGDSVYFSSLLYQGSLDKCISHYNISAVLAGHLWSMNIFYNYTVNT